MQRMRRTLAATVLVATFALGTAGVAAADDGLLGGLNGAVTQVGALAEPVVAPVLEPVADTVSEVVAPVVEAAAPVVAPVVQTAAPVLEPVVDAVAPAVDALEPVVEPVKQATAPLTDAVEDVLAPVVELVDETVAPVLEPAEQPPAPGSEDTGSGPPAQAAPDKPHQSSGPSPVSGIAPAGASAAAAGHGSIAVPAPIMATVVADAREQRGNAVTPIAQVRFGESRPTDAFAPLTVWERTSTGGSAAEAAATSLGKSASEATPFERFAGSLKAFGDDVATLVASNASWAAASFSVSVAAALAVIVLMAFPGLWLRLRPASDRSPPVLTASPFERPG